MLDVSLLKNELLKLMDPQNPNFVGHPANPAAAATNYANAYDLYASMAADTSGDLVLVKFKPLFEAVLAASLPPGPAGSAPAAAIAFDTAFVAYWTGAAFSVGIPPPPGGLCPNVGATPAFSVELLSVVVAVVPGVLQSALLSTWNNTEDPSQSAEVMANAFHLATTTAISVLITGLDVTPPPAGPLPIANTCTVF